MAKPSTPEETVAALRKLSERSDSSYVLFMTTALEDMLERALLYKMRNLSKIQHQDLFTGYGPLSSFAAKIDIAYAFSIIDDDVLGDFRALKSIRNAFAHPRQEIHFGSATLTSKFQKLKGYLKGEDRQKLFDKRLNACISVLDKYNEAQIFISALQKRDSPITSRDKRK